MGFSTRTYDSVRLVARCPEDHVPGPEDLRADRTIMGPGGRVVETTYYWPPPPTGPTAGYTSPLIGWGETRITGLTSAPIVLHGTYSQSYHPEHHNFGAEYIFEPRLEPGLDQNILAELEAQDIQLLFVDERGRFVAQGFDGTLRDL
jgi:hypothetical protein